MRFDNPVPLKTIAALIAAEIKGDENAAATGINEIHMVQPGDLVFVDHPKYYNQCLHSAASFIIINQEVEVPSGKAILIVAEPFEAYLKIVKQYRPFLPSLVPVAATARIAASAVVMPHVFIGNRVTIGENVVVYPNVTIMDDCIIGDNVIIQSGTTIGSDAFYYNKKTDRPLHYKKMLSCGRVVIEHDVEIGAGCTIDRGVTGDTTIGAGTKLDNLVHIGHDTTVGKNCLFAAQVGVAGATTIEDDVILWGQVGVSKTLTIGKGAVVMAQSGVPASIAGGKNYFGSPVADAKEKMKELVWVKRIPQLWKKVFGDD